jgi:uncharacterized membrane protein YbhN (UPF0104 family)
MVNIALFSTGTLNSYVDEGVETASGSGCLAVAVKMKKVSNNDATSHMAVISVTVLVLLTLILGIIFFTSFNNDDLFSGFP